MKFAPFSKKQRVVFEWWLPGSGYEHKLGIICDGSVRSGKTMSMSLSFIIWSMTTFSECNLALCGKTILSLRRNVITDLLRMVRSRGYKVHEVRNENKIVISRGKTENIYYLFGGKDEASQDLIQGITLAGIFFDEVALMPESFINQGMARCSVDGAKFWFNCNPQGPDHWFKLKWIDHISEKGLIRLHFTMDDNLSLTQATRETYEKEYSGVFYDRFISGLWVPAEGLIFRFFTEHSGDYLVNDDGLPHDDDRDTGKRIYTFSKIVIGGDFGGHLSATSFHATGYADGYHKLYPLDEEALPITDEINSDDICKAYLKFYARIVNTYGHVSYVFLDSASPTMINSIRSAAREAGLPWRMIVGCRKNDITQRPVTVDKLLNTGRLFIHRRCANLIKALSQIRWDEKHPDQPQDKNIGNINDYWDSFCYTWLDFVEYIDLDRRG